MKFLTSSWYKPVSFSARAFAFYMAVVYMLSFAWFSESFGNRSWLNLMTTVALFFSAFIPNNSLRLNASIRSISIVAGILGFTSEIVNIYMLRILPNAAAGPLAFSVTDLLTLVVLVEFLIRAFNMRKYNAILQG